MVALTLDNVRKRRAHGTSTKADLPTREAAFSSADTASLAAVPAVETGRGPDSVEPRVAAHALIGVHHALIDDARRMIVDGTPPERVERDLLTEAKVALAQLEKELGSYVLSEPP